MATRSKTGSRTKSKKPATASRAKGAKKAKAVAKPKRKPKVLARAKGKSPAPRRRIALSGQAGKPLPGVRRGSRLRPLLPQPRALPARRPKVLAANPYDLDLERNPANYQPLTPISFLQRAALAYPQITAIIHGTRRTSYAEFYARSRRLASALAREGIGRGDTVSALLANTPAMLEAHHGVPMTGAC